MNKYVYKKKIERREGDKKEINWSLRMLLKGWLCCNGEGGVGNFFIFELDI